MQAIRDSLNSLRPDDAAVLALGDRVRQLEALVAQSHVQATEREKRLAVEAVEREKERCARLIGRWRFGGDVDLCDAIAAAIRKGE